MRWLIPPITASAILIGAMPALAQEPARHSPRREARSGSNNEAQGASFDTTMDNNHVTAHVNVPGETSTSGPAQRRASVGPTRPKTCLYAPNEKAITIFGITMLTFSQLRDAYEVGDSVEFTCVYSDVPYYESYSGIYTLGTSPPDAEQNGAARDALDRWLSLDFPSPQVHGKPRLDDQRIAIDTWFAVPTLAGPVTAVIDGVRLKAVPRPLVSFDVPVGRWGAEQFTCNDPGAGPDQAPNGRCAHAFNHATDGTQLASISIVFDVYVSVDAVGVMDLFVDLVTRTSQVPMQVKEIQAVGR